MKKIHFKEFSYETCKEYFDKDAVFTYDTESCGEIVDGVQTAHVYASAVMCSKSDTMVYGNTCLDVLIIFKIIADKNKKSRFDILVHNLKWDYVFMAHELNEIGNKEITSKVNKMKLVKEVSKGRKTLEKNQRFIIAKKEHIYQALITMDYEIEGKSQPRKKVDGVETRTRVDKTKVIHFNFTCTLNRFPSSLERIAEKLLKLDERFWKISGYDYEKHRPKGTHVLTEEEQDYLYNDVYIIKEFYNQFMKPYNFTKLTASSHAFNFFIADTFGHEKQKDNQKEFDKLFPPNQNFTTARASYRGGYTSGNRDYMGRDIVLKNLGTSVDINSSYPSVVKKKPLPCGVGVKTNGYVKAKNNHMNLLCISFDAFRPKDETNPFGEFQRGSATGVKGRASEYVTTNIIDGEIDFSIGATTFIGNDEMKVGYVPNSKHVYVWQVWEFELEDILKNYELLVLPSQDDEEDEDWDGFGSLDATTLEVGYHVEHTVTYPYKVGVFANTVDKCMEMKNKGKREGNTPLMEQGKLLANSFYGKMGAKPRRDIHHDVFSEKGIMSRQIKDVDENGNDLEFLYESDEVFFVPFASAVTGWARCNLRNRLYEIGVHNVIYFDTDSLYTLLPKNELEATGIPIDEYELGDWKIERQYDKIKVIASKKYILNDVKDGIVVKCLGLPKEAQKNITFEKFHIGAEVDGGKKKKKVKGGCLLIDSPYKIKEFD